MRLSSARIWGAFALLSLVGWPTTVVAQTTIPRTEIFGTVLDRVSGEPLVDAVVVLSPGDSERESWTGVTNGSGRFRTTGLPLGEYDLSVAATTFKPLRGMVELEQPGTVDLRVQMVPVDFALEPVIAAATRRSRLEEVGFYDRLRFGDGHYITREELDEHAPFNVSEVLRGVPGVRVLPGIARANTVLLRGGCVPRVVLDGLLLSGPVDVDYLLPTIDIAGIEIYHGASAPILYTGETTCGVIMLWSRVPDLAEAPTHTWKRSIFILGFTIITMLGFAP